MNGTRKLIDLMLEWEDLQEQISKVEDSIELYVMDLEKTQTAGNVRATYGKGRKNYDYQAAAKDVKASVVDLYSTETVVVKVDWKKLCENEMITDIPFTQGDPYVKIKLMK
jgi:hypothetical protein